MALKLPKELPLRQAIPVLLPPTPLPPEAALKSRRGAVFTERVGRWFWERKLPDHVNIYHLWLVKNLKGYWLAGQRSVQ